MSARVRVGDAGGKGLGVFAGRAFRRGERILRFRGRVVRRDELAALTEWESLHLGELAADTYQVLPAPRCYLNHSCAPNAVSTSDAVYAWRDVAPGEEITVDYRLNAHDDHAWEMRCLCDARPAPHVVVGDFFALPDEAQDAYAPWAPPFIREEYRRRRGLAELLAHPAAHWPA